MVRNITGGKKAKSVARFVAPAMFRPAKEDGELYAIVEKNMGNGILNVTCIDAKIRRCMVRKKFTGRQRDVLQVGTWILVGLREFETVKDKCDLIEIYTPADVARLQLLDVPWHVFGVEKTQADDGIEFVDTVDIQESAPVSLGLDSTEINFDDI
jgi:initiation factor 1A